MPEQIVNNDLKFFFKEIEILNLQNKKLLEYSHSRFNIFTIIREGTEEVGLHSAFISELLNPKGSHQMGSTFLELFLNKILLENEKLKSENTSVETEKWIGKIDGDKGGAIDIFITNDDYIIAIENKIYAGDQHNQLLRYHNFIKDTHSNSFLFYLTLDGHSPSKDSIKDLEEREDFNNISYSENIISWLKLCKEKVCDIPRIKEPIQQYIDLVKELNGQSLNDEYIMEIKDFITKDSKNLKLARDVTEAFEKLKQEIRPLFWKALEDKLNEKLSDKKIERHDYDRNRYQGINIYFKNNNKFCFRVEIGKEVEERIYFGFHILNGQNTLDDNYRKEMFDKISEKFDNYKFNKESTWFGWAYVNTKNIKNFNFKTFNPEETFKLANEAERQKLVYKLTNEIKEMLINSKQIIKS